MAIIINTVSIIINSVSIINTANMFQVLQAMDAMRFDSNEQAEIISAVRIMMIRMIMVVIRVMVVIMAMMVPVVMMTMMVPVVMMIIIIIGSGGDNPSPWKYFLR